MPEGSTSDLLLLAALCALGSYLLVREPLGRPLAAALALFRSGVPLIYFACFYDGSWTFLDDATYHINGGLLLAAGYDPLSVLWEHDGRVMLTELSQGSHTLYTWWNMSAQHLFGEHYFSAVFMNVLVTFAVARAFFGMLSAGGYGASALGHAYARGAAVFFLIHPEVVVWSSFINLKDLLVMGLTFAALRGAGQLADGQGARGVVILAISFVLLWSLRYYVPVLVTAAAALALFARPGLALKFILAPLAVWAYFFLLPWEWDDLDMFRAGEVLYGMLHVLLTPKPWNIDEEFSYLAFPAAFHWTMLVPMLIGGARLWKRVPQARIFLCYFAIVLFFYGSVPDLQGPRHRVQVAFICAWMQFQGLYLLIPGLAGALQPAHPLVVARRA